MILGVVLWRVGLHYEMKGYVINLGVVCGGWESHSID